MLTERYGLPLSTNSSAARDAYDEGVAAKLTMYPGAIASFDRAIAADPGFALAHAAKAHLLLERGEAAAAREAIATAKSLAADSHANNLSEREAGHVAFFDLLVSGDAEAALSALLAHLEAWPRDAVVLGTAAFTNGLIGSSGRAGQKRMLLELLERLAPSWGDDWWFAAHHGMALSENGQREAARPKIERSLAQNPQNPWAAHAKAHLCYEEGDAETARAFLASWLPTYPRDGSLYSHLSWHLALVHLEAGDIAEARLLFREAFAPDVHSGPPRGRVNDAVSFLWRCELAGHQRDVEMWRVMHDFATSAFPRAGAAFSDLHIALAQAVAGDHAALEARTAQIGELAHGGKYPSGALVPAAARGFAAVERGDFAAAIEALEPIAGELERIGGSRAQLDLIEFTLLHAYLGAGRRDEARRILRERGRGASRLPVAGLEEAAA
jgi:tetratricopeptide (TPR) repeat protein